MEGPLVCLCWLCIMTTLGCLTPVYSISHCYLICHSRDICRYFEHSFCCFFIILGSLSQICWQLNELLLAYCSVCKGKGKCFPILDTERWARSWSQCTGSQLAGDHKSSTRWWAAITFCQACGYLPSRRASPPFGRYQVILLGDRGT